jgi:hypothetical protein
VTTDWVGSSELPLWSNTELDPDVVGNWWALDDIERARMLEKELVREIGHPGHALYGAAVAARAERQDQDDVLYELADGRFAIVHLSWADDPEVHSDYPSTTLFDSWIDALSRIRADQADFRTPSQ